MKDKNEIVNIQGVPCELTAWEKLNGKRRMFVLEYCRCFNASQAYRLAYPGKKTDETVRAASARLLASVNIKQAIQEKLASLWSEREHEAGRTLLEVMAVAFSDIAEVVEIKNGYLKVKDLDTIDSRIIQSIKSTKTVDSETITVTLHNKVQALTILSKILNMITEKTEYGGTITVIPAVEPEVQPEEPIEENVD